jgi:hypothetical protein
VAAADQLILSATDDTGEASTNDGGTRLEADAGFTAVGAETTTAGVGVFGVATGEGESVAAAVVAGLLGVDAITDAVVVAGWAAAAGKAGAGEAAAVGFAGAGEAEGVVWARVGDGVPSVVKVVGVECAGIWGVWEEAAAAVALIGVETTSLTGETATWVWFD